MNLASPLAPCRSLRSLQMAGIRSAAACRPSTSTPRHAPARHRSCESASATSRSSTGIAEIVRTSGPPVRRRNASRKLAMGLVVASRGRRSASPKIDIDIVSCK